MEKIDQKAEMHYSTITEKLYLQAFWKELFKNWQDLKLILQELDVRDGAF